MSVVYWSPFAEVEDYAALQFLYDEPDALTPLIVNKRNKENRHDNFTNCHAFLNNTKNTFVLRNPFNIDVKLDNKFGIISLNNQTAHNSHFMIPKASSLNNAKTFSIYANWLFWSPEPLVIQTSPAYYHPPLVDGYYVAGSFDINAWFRPVEAAIQLNEGIDEIHVERGEPIAYAKFHSSETIKLQRFFLTPELRQLAKSCIHYKTQEKSLSLNAMYKLFKNRGMDKVIKREIERNLM